MLGLCCCVWTFLQSRCTGFSLWWLLVLWSTGSRRGAFSDCSVQAQQLQLPSSRGQAPLVMHEFSCPAAGGVFPDEGWNPGLLPWQADSLPWCHQGSPAAWTFYSHIKRIEQRAKHIQSLPSQSSRKDAH